MLCCVVYTHQSRVRHALLKPGLKLVEVARRWNAWHTQLGADAHSISIRVARSRVEGGEVSTGADLAIEPSVVKLVEAADGGCVRLALGEDNVGNGWHLFVCRVSCQKNGVLGLSCE